jgi:MFS family permease
VLAVSFFMTVADLAIVNVALPTIGRELHMPESSLQWVVTGYALTFGGFLLLGGRAADLLGRRRVLMAGLAVFTASSLACGLATAIAPLPSSVTISRCSNCSRVGRHFFTIRNLQFAMGIFGAEQINTWRRAGSGAREPGVLASLGRGQNVGARARPHRL